MQVIMLNRVRIFKPDILKFRLLSERITSISRHLQGEFSAFIEGNFDVIAFYHDAVTGFVECRQSVLHTQLFL